MLKVKRPIKCWTDYPFIELGDKVGQTAPIRHVVIIDHDGDKYVTVKDLATGAEEMIKKGYVYSQPGRSDIAKRVNPDKIARAFGRPTFRTYCKQSGGKIVKEVYRGKRITSCEW